MAPVGFEVVRVTDPMIGLRADVAILFTVSVNDKAKEYLAKIRTILKDADIDSHVVECDVTDTAVVLDEIGSIVLGAPHHDFFFNASTGAKTACIAGILAGMLWPVQPYHVPVDYEAAHVHLPRDQPVTGPPNFIPTFRVVPLDGDAVTALDFLAGRGGDVAKFDLIKELKVKGILSPRKGTGVTPQALQAQANRILHRLEDWGFVELQGHGAKFRIRTTDKGKAGARMFQHVLKKPTPPSLLLP